MKCIRSDRAYLIPRLLLKINDFLKVGNIVKFMNLKQPIAENPFNLLKSMNRLKRSKPVRRAALDEP